MATVTVTFRDDFQGEEGVQVELKSDPAMTEDRSKWTEAQHMAMGLLHMLDQTMRMQAEAESHAHGACPVTGMKAQSEEPKSCDGNGGCGGGGHCSRHEHTEPEDCCKNH